MLRSLTLLLLAPVLLLAENEALHVMYAPDHPIRQTSEIIIDIEQQLPDQVVHSRTTQLFESELTMITPSDKVGDQAVIQGPPFGLQVVLKRCRIDVQVNGQTTSFDTEDDAQLISVPFVAQMRQAIDRPLILKYGSEFNVNPAVEELQQLFVDLPMLQQYFTPQTFSQLYDHLFLIAGDSIHIGDHVQRAVQVGQLEGVQVPISVNIVAANFKEIEAELSGRLPEQSLQMPSDDEEEALDLLISGQVTGKASWMRSHGLLGDYKVHHFYNGKLRAGVDEWPVKMTITQRVHSERKG